MESLWPEEGEGYGSDHEDEGYDVGGDGGEEEEDALPLLHNVLPLEVMQHIVVQLDPASVGRAECVCRAWRVACLSPFVWEAVYRRHFASRTSSSAQGNWRELCARAGRSLREYAREEQPVVRAWNIIRWCCGAGFDRVLDEFLQREGANVSLDVLNGRLCSSSSSPSAAVVDPQAPSGFLSWLEKANPARLNPIYLAASNGYAEVIEMLVLAGADVNLGFQGHTALSVAVSKGFLDAVEVLLRHGAGGDDFARPGAEAQQSFGKGARPLWFEAAAAGHIKVMKVLVARAGGEERLRTMINAVEARSGKTALHYAAERGHAEVAALLLGQGAEKDCLSASKQSPLHMAALGGSASVVRLLLEHGAKVAFSSAEANSHKDEEIVSLLLEQGLDVNLTEENGRTPLLRALLADHKASFVQFLLDRGADVHAKDKQSIGAIACALRSLHTPETVEVCRCLIAAGADIPNITFKLLEPQCRAHCNNTSVTVELIDLFAEHGIDARKPRIGIPLLRAAALYLQYDLVEALLDRGVDPNGPSLDITELLPLHAALRAELDWVSGGLTTKKRVIQLLIERGADVNRLAGNDLSPPLFNLPHYHSPILHHMLAHGADINATNRRGWTLLHKTAMQWPGNQGRLNQLMEWITTLIAAGADPGLCLEGELAPQADVADPPAWVATWLAFLRGVGIPLRPAGTPTPPL